MESMDEDGDGDGDGDWELTGSKQKVFAGGLDLGMGAGVDSQCTQ